MRDNPEVGPAWLTDRLAGGGVVLLDGGVGTELEKRGVSMDGNAWSGRAVLDGADVLRQVHEDFIRAGAEVVITNTFASGRHMLEPAGAGEHVAEINRSAARIALEARDTAAEGPVSVAGSMCEWTTATDHPKWGTPEGVGEALREQAGLLAEAGVELIALEMCQRLELTTLAVEAALSTGLPVWLGASCGRAEEGGPLVGFSAHAKDRDFGELIAGAAGAGVGVVNIMHSAIADSSDAIDVVRRHWQGPIGIYPESGYFTMPNWQFVDIIEPDDLVGEAKGWIESGVQLVGGCCGLGPDHIRALKDGLA